MKRWLLLPLLLVCAAPLGAQVILPASGHLAGPLEPSQSQLGDQFFNFPPELGERPRPGESPLSGWLEITFAEADEVPAGACLLPILDPAQQVYFFPSFDSAGPTDMWAFENGQAWLLDDNRAFNNPALPNCGVLNLATGRVDGILLSPTFQNSTIAQVDKNNRISFAFPPTYPLLLTPDLVQLLQVILPILFDPGFIFNDALFIYDPDGRITGFQFFGKTVVPVGVAALLNPVINAFPPQAFGPNGQFYFAVPYECLATSGFCPTQQDSPNGMQLPTLAFFRPYFALGSKRLREVDAERVVPPCETVRRTDGVMVALDNTIYHMGGLSGTQVLNRVDVYDRATNTWSQGPDLPVAVQQAQGGAIGSKIYVYGGRDQDGNILDTLQVFDAAAGTWSLGMPGPLPIANGVAAAIANALYVTGGEGGNDPVFPGYNKGVIVYHAAGPASPPAWEALAVNLPNFVVGASAVALGAKMYVLGGLELDAITGEHSVTDTVTVFTAVNDSVAEGAPLEHPVYEAAAGLAANRIYLIGGRREEFGPAVPEVQLMIISDDEWRRDRPMPLPVAGACAATLNGEIYVSAGRTTRGSLYPGPTVRAVQALHPGRGWAVCESDPVYSSGTLSSSASLTVGPQFLSPGSLAVLTGYNFGGPAEAAPGQNVPTALAGLRITVDGLDAPILAVSPNRVDFQIPYGVAPGPAADIRLTKNGMVEPRRIFYPIAETSPGIYVETYGETREQLFLDKASAVACNPDGFLNYAGDSVARGETITLQVTGLGEVDAMLANGERSPGGVGPLAAVTAMIDGIPSTVTSVELAAGELGLFEVDVVVPPGARSENRIPVWIEAGGVRSNEAAIAVATNETPIQGDLPPGLPVPPRQPLPCPRPIPVDGE